MKDTVQPEPETARAIVEGRHGDPFSHLGLHEVDGTLVLRVSRPGADRVEILDAKDGRPVASLTPVDTAEGLFCATIPRRKRRFAYRLRVSQGAETWEEHDAYAFGPLLGELDEHLLGEGTHGRLWEALGAHVMTHDGVAGTRFAIWAPNARRVSVVGGFNDWDGRRHVMRKRGATGVWEIFIPGLGEGVPYKYELLDRHGQLLPLKADPVGFGAEVPPATASVIRDLGRYAWTDARWMETRGAAQKIDHPISVYEVHLASWRRVPEEGDRPLTYLEHAEHLVGYAADMGFTHIELTSASEHVLGGPWGYQPVGLFAPTARFGTPDELRALVDAAHGAGLGIILDWVPGHFPNDQHGLAQFDGTALFEHADPSEGLRTDGDTLAYDHGRREFRNFLISNARFWIEEYHIDGLRVDAVAAMLRRDHSQEGARVSDRNGCRETLEGIAFLQQMNEELYGADDGIMTIAEEATGYPGVSLPTHAGGLGFGFKWNTGWTRDTLRYMSEEPNNRKHHHDKMTSWLQDAFSENFVLPLSHDAVVQDKGSLLGRMPGDSWQRFANLRAYYGFMWGHPGKKLLFMGGEFAQWGEWNHDRSLDWHLLEQEESHQGIQRLVRDLNRIYRETSALHQRDTKPEGFRWIDGGNREDSIFSWVRYGHDGTDPVLVVVNLTPETRTGYRIGVPHPGHWEEILNTNAAIYGGSDTGNPGGRHADQVTQHGCPWSLELTVPPLAAVWFRLARQT